MNLNRCIRIGRIAAAPLLRKTRSGRSVLEFTVISNDDNGDAETIDCVQFDQAAEATARNVAVGRLLRVEGSLRKVRLRSRRFFKVENSELEQWLQSNEQTMDKEKLAEMVAGLEPHTYDKYKLFVGGVSNALTWLDSRPSNAGAQTLFSQGGE